MTSQEYWEEREKQKQQKIDEVTEVEIEKVRQAIADTVEALDHEIHRIYMKYAVDNKLDYWDALQYLTDDERKEFQRDLQYYVDKYHDTDYVKKYKKELHSLSVRARVQRIEAFKANIKQHSSDLEEMLNTDVRNSISSLYTLGYMNALYESTLGAQPEAAQIRPAFNPQAIREILDTPWSGKNFSSKVWDLSGDFAKKLEEKLIQGLIQGKHPDVIAREFRALGFGKEKSIGRGGLAWRAESLIRTEAANLVEQAQLNSYIDTGVEEYIFMTANDSRVCSECAKLNNKAFPTSEAKQGVNYPVMHPVCHCTTKAKTPFDDNSEEYYELYKADYDEWYKRYIQPEIDAEQAAKSAKLDIEEGIAPIEKEFGTLNTREVILTDERKGHIKERHPEAFNTFIANYAKCVSTPDLILKDFKNDSTVFMIKQLEDNSLNTIVKLSIGADNTTLKNSVITGYAIGEKRLERLKKKNKILYIKNKV